MVCSILLGMSWFVIKVMVVGCNRWCLWWCVFGYGLGKKI